MSFLGHATEALALDYREVLYPKILKILDDEKIILDIGVEDGVIRGNHARITFEDQYVGRIVAMDARSGKSLWKLYRVISEDILEVGKTIKFRAMSIQKLPEEHRKLLEEVPKRELEAYEQGVDPAALEQEEEDAQAWRVNDKDALDKDLNTLIEGERSKGDGWVVGFEPKPGPFDKFNFEIQIAPYKTAWKDREKEMTYGVSVANDQTDKFETKLAYQHTSSESETLSDGVVTRTVNSLHQFDGTFVVKKIIGNFSYISEIHYEREKDNNYYPQKNHYTGSPVGVRYDFLESDKVKELSLSYLPEIDYLEYEEENTGYASQCTQIGVDTDGDGINDSFESSCEDVEYGYLSEKKTVKLRHTLKFVMDIAINEIFSFSDTLYHRPAHDFVNNRVEWTDANLENTFEFKVNLLDKLNLSYKNTYTWDTYTGFEQKIGSSNMIHEVNLGVLFSI